MRSGLPARRWNGDRLFLASPSAVQMRPAGHSRLRLESQDAEERHMRRADLRDLHHLSCPGQGSVPAARADLSGLEGGQAMTRSMGGE